MKHKPISDAIEMMNIIGGGDPERRARLDLIRARKRLIRDLYAARQRSGLTQAELAQRMGTSQSTVARLERGEDHSPTLRTLERMALALRVELRIEIVEPGGRKKSA